MRVHVACGAAIAAVVLMACGGTVAGQAPQPSAVPSPAVAAAIASPAAATAIASPSASPRLSSTATPAAVVVTVWVANTDGGGVFLRNSPEDGDRAEVLAENTPLTVTGELTEGDGRNWYPVRLADGSSGYVPQTYTTMTDPQAAPLPLVPNQAR